MSVQIQVYLDDGRVFAYMVEGEDATTRAREHVHMIGQHGYRSVIPGELVLYPVHRITKIKAVEVGDATETPEPDEGITSNYPETVRGT